jgi:hypothetical protein
MRKQLGLEKKPLNLYIDSETYAALAARAEEWEMKPSQMVSGLVRTLCDLPLDYQQKKIEAALKVKYGRDQFIAFLRSVAQAIPPEAKSIRKPGVKEEYQPDTWLLGSIGILAFFNPSEENVGQVFSAATTLKAEHKLTEVIVVSPLADTMPQSTRSDLAGAKIAVVSIADLTIQLKKHIRTEQRKK